VPGPFVLIHSGTVIGATPGYRFLETRSRVPCRAYRGHAWLADPENTLSRAGSGVFHSKLYSGRGTDIPPRKTSFAMRGQTSRGPFILILSGAVVGAKELACAREVLADPENTLDVSRAGSGVTQNFFTNERGGLTPTRSGTRKRVPRYNNTSLAQASSLGPNR
jgi:hypothetical protein